MLCGMSGRPSAGDFKANSLRRRDTPLQSTDNRCVTRAVAQIPRGEPFRQDADLQDEFPAQRRCELRGVIDGYREGATTGPGSRLPSIMKMVLSARRISLSAPRPRHRLIPWASKELFRPDRCRRSVGNGSRCRLGGPRRGARSPGHGRTPRRGPPTETP